MVLLWLWLHELKSELAAGTVCPSHHTSKQQSSLKASVQSLLGENSEKICTCAMPIERFLVRMSEIAFAVFHLIWLDDCSKIFPFEHMCRLADKTSFAKSSCSAAHPHRVLASVSSRAFSMHKLQTFSKYLLKTSITIQLFHYKTQIQSVR